MLGVLGNANLYLINPNGILFGENARLDVNGSFFATTAESVLFENGFEFSAVNPDAPPLLKIDIPIGLRFRDNPAPITNLSFVLNNTFTDFVGLEVPPGENLTFVGGDINFEGGEATAPGGRIDLGALSSAGIVTINKNGSLTFPEDLTRADIIFTNAADVDVRAAGGGSISVNARNIELSGGEFGGSRLRAGIAPESGLTTAQAGDININATDTISVNQESLISNRVEELGTGNAGGINIMTTSLSLMDEGQLDASTLGQGNAGQVKIKASESINVNNGADIFAIVGNNAQGNGGEININTNSLSISDQASFISVSTLGEGNAGTINIAASESIKVNNSGDIWAIVFESGVGNAGQININTNQLDINSNSILSVSTLGQGDAGELNINTSESIDVSNGADIFAIVGNNAQGDGGQININTNNLNISDQAASISVSTLGEGNAGTINIAASESIKVNNSGDIWAIVFESGVGNAGQININTNQLDINSNSILSVSTLGQGDAGELNINTSESINVSNGSAIFAFTDGIGVSDGAQIDISTHNLSLTDDSLILASTFREGNSGLIFINASGSISLDNSNIFNRVRENGQGNSGGIEILTSNLGMVQKQPILGNKTAGI